MMLPPAPLLVEKGRDVPRFASRRDLLRTLQTFLLFGMLAAIGATMAFGGIQPPLSASAHAPGFAMTLTEVQVLDTPELGTTPTATLPAGTTVVLTGDVADGYLSVTFDGGSGWVNSDLLSVSGRPGIITSVVTSRTLILDGPFPDARELSALEPDEAVMLTGAVAGDYAAVSRDGVGGWVNRSDLGLTPLG